MFSVFKLREDKRYDSSMNIYNNLDMKKRGRVEKDFFCLKF